MADLLIRDTDRDELIRDTADEVVRLLKPLIESSAQPMLVDGDTMAQLAGVSRPTIDRAVRTGLIPSVLIGRSRRFQPDLVIKAFVDAE